MLMLFQDKLIRNSCAGGGMYYDWDESKNEKNQQKHGVGFEEAVTVFLDRERLVAVDTAHSTPTETRFLTIGLAGTRRHLLVCYCERKREKNVEVIRIISARKAGKEDRRRYMGGI